MCKFDIAILDYFDSPSEMISIIEDWLMAHFQNPHNYAIGCGHGHWQVFSIFLENDDIMDVSSVFRNDFSEEIRDFNT